MWSGRGLSWRSVISLTVRGHGGVWPAVTASDVEHHPPRFDLSALAWATPADLAILAVHHRLALAHGEVPEVVPPAAAAVAAYLEAMGLQDQLDYPVAGPPLPLSGEPPLIPLLCLKEAIEWEAEANRLWPLVCERLGDYALARQLLDITGELADNAATHGASPGGFAVCAQRYTGATSGLRPGIWLGLADVGVGIPDHLRRNPQYAGETDDLRLLRLARQPEVTGTADRRGYGLGDVFEHAAKAGGGWLVIESGHAGAQYVISDRLQTARYWRTEPRLVGTWVQLFLPA